MRDVLMTAFTKTKLVVALIRPEVTLAVGACVIAGETLMLRNLLIREAFLGLMMSFFISSATMVVNVLANSLQTSTIGGNHGL